MALLKCFKSSPIEPSTAVQLQVEDYETTNQPMAFFGKGKHLVGGQNGATCHVHAVSPSKGSKIGYSSAQLLVAPLQALSSSSHAHKFAKELAVNSTHRSVSSFVCLRSLGQAC